MAFNTAAASNTPDIKRLPISALHPGLPSLATQSIVAIVTLVWPYSSNSRSCALLLAEPDFRLRRRRGQVRVQFLADAAHAVATSGVGIGDVVVLRLGPGVQWLASSGEEEVVRTPGKSVEWEIGYRRALRLRAWRDGELLASLDVRGEDTPEPQIEELEQEHVYNTPSKIVGRFSGEGLKMGSWDSPAFLKRSRLSLDSLRDGQDLFAYDDGHVEGKGRKKRKSWMNVGMWTYANRTPSPEKDRVLPAAGAMSLTPEDATTAGPVDILRTPESTKTTTEADENEELIPEHPENEPVQDHAEIFPNAAPQEAVELLKEDVINQQYLTETSRTGFVRGDTEENTEVDELLSEPEERMDGQLSYQELKALDKDESSTEEDEAPLLVSGALPQSQANDYSGDTEEDSDDAYFQVRELDRSLTPTEIDSDEDKVDESGARARSSLEDLPSEEPVKTANQEEEATEIPAERQSNASRAMLPPAFRPVGLDESATRTPPRVPKSFAQVPDQVPPTPQLQPVTSMNLPLPSPFPGTSTSEPASYMDARPLAQTEESTETENSVSQKPKQLLIVQEEQDPMKTGRPDFNPSAVLPLEPSLDQTQIPTYGNLDDLKAVQASTEPFEFGLDGSALSRIGLNKAYDSSQQRPPDADETGEGLQGGVAKPSIPGPTSISSEDSNLLHKRCPSKETWMDGLAQTQRQEDKQQLTVHSAEDEAETRKRTSESETLPPKERSDGLPAVPAGVQPPAHKSVYKLPDEGPGVNEGPALQDTVDHVQPQSFSFDDGYIPMIDDWEIPNLDSDPVDVSMAEPSDKNSFAPTLEDDHERTPVGNTITISPKTEVIDVDNPFPEPPPKPAKLEVTIVDLSDSTDSDEEPDAERATTNEGTPQALIASPAFVSAGKEIIGESVEPPMKPAELKTPKKPSSQIPSPWKSSHQRLRSPFSDVDHMDLSQDGTQRWLRPIVTPDSQASSIVERASSRRRRMEVKGSESEWDSTASVSTQKPSSPPSEAADSKPLDDYAHHSGFITTQDVEELAQQYVRDPAEGSSTPVAAAQLRLWDDGRYASRSASQILEEFPQKPVEEPLQRPPQSLQQNRQSPEKSSLVSPFEKPAPSSTEVKQNEGAQSEFSEEIHESLPTAELSSDAPSEKYRYVREGSPGHEKSDIMARNFVTPSSPLPEHVEPTSEKQFHSPMLVDDPSLMMAMQTSQATFSTQPQNRMTSSPPLEDGIPMFDSAQAEHKMTQNKASSPTRSHSVASISRQVASRLCSVPSEVKSEAALSAELRDSVDLDMHMVDDMTPSAKALERSQGLPKAAAENESANRPAQKSPLTPESTQQIAFVPSAFPGAVIEQTLPPTPRPTQASHVVDGFDLTQAKAKTQDLKIVEPASPHEARADTTMDDTTLVEAPINQRQALHRAEPTSQSFSVQSVEEAKSPSPTFSERVRRYESSQPDASQRSAYSQSQGLRTALGYFTSLSSLPQHLNSQAQIDILAVCTRATKRPERATAGPKDYFTSFRIADESLDSKATSVQVQVFRPWKAALPECDVGDAVLLRNFVPKSRKGKVGLISAAESAWCVFRYGKNLSQRTAANDSQSQSQSKPQANGDVENEDKESQPNEKSDRKSDGHKEKRKSNIMDSLRPIWADTMSGLWGDLTGVIDGLDDEDATGAQNRDSKASGVKGKDEPKEQQAKSDFEHGRYNPESGASREECHGPPVEYGDQERREARRLREWWVGGSGSGAVAKMNGYV